VDELITGFYHIAKNAGVPLVLVGFDFKNKHVVLNNPIFVSEFENTDLKRIIRFFSTVKGANPKQDLLHLTKVEP